MRVDSISRMKKVIVLAAILVTIGSAVYAKDPPKTGGNATFNGNGQPTGAEGGVHISF
jgi:hypothetical protein